MAQYEVTLRDYWRILRRRKGIVVLTALLMAGFSFTIASVRKPVPLYEATAKVQLNLHQNLTGLYLQTIAYNSGDQIETQQAIISSHPVLVRTGLERGRFYGAVTADDTAAVILGLHRQIKTEQEGYTNIIGIQVTDPDPSEARDLANAVARVYRDYDHELKNQQAIKHRQFVEARRENARRVLERAEEAVRTYREETDLISLESQASVNLQQITAAQQAGQRLQQDLVGIKAMVAEMESGKGLSEKALTGAFRTRVGETFMGLSRQLSTLRLEQDALLVQYTPDHPSAQRLQVKIDQLGQDLLQELQQRQLSLARDLAAEQSRLAQLRRGYSQLPSLGLELGRLEREVTMRQEVVTVLEESYQEALIREADKVEEVAVLEWALTPTYPVNPNHPLKRAIMGLLLGVILGIVFAVVAETLDTSIGTIEDVQEYTGTKVVGIVPFINMDDVRASLEQRGVDVSDERTVQRKAQLVAYFDPQSTLAESYRTLRTNIEFVTVEKGARCLMVTSSMHHEGKSTTIANLSMMMAQLGKRTLLVDCDLRKPSLARLFGLEKEPGTTEVIVGNYAWRDVVRTVTDIVTGGMGMEDILQTQGIGNLHIITSGSIPPNPSELLNSRRMAEFVEEVKEAYDVVLFDSPPVLHVTDAAILGKLMDGALMVYKAGDIARTSLKRSTTLLKGVEIELLGVVVNGIRADLSTEYHDLGYQAYYAYGSDVAAPQRTAEQRVRDWLRQAKRRVGFGDQEAGPEPEATELNPPPTRSASVGTARRVAAYVALVAVGFGVAWQSGYLTRPLGLIPVLSERLGRVSSAGEPQETETPAAMAATPISETVASRSATRAAAERTDIGEPVAVESRPAHAVDEAPPSGQTAATDRASGARQRAPIADALEPADADLPIGQSSRAYVIRAGSYARGNRWSATVLARLREQGESAFLSPVPGQPRPLERVLVGRFHTWDEAYARARRLRELGAIEEFTILRLPYSVELARHGSTEDASRALADLGRMSSFAHVEADERGEALLLAGAFATPEEARELRTTILEELSVSADK